MHVGEDGGRWLEREQEKRYTLHPSWLEEEQNSILPQRVTTNTSRPLEGEKRMDAVQEEYRITNWGSG